MKNLFRVFLVAVLVISPLKAYSAAVDHPCKEPNVSGAFYPSSPQELRREIAGYLQSFPPQPALGHIAGLISPHAGYAYSGQVAGHAYRLIKGQKYNTVIILAPSHYFPIPAAAIFGRGSFRTPLGEVPVDEDFVNQLTAVEPAFSQMPNVFEREHSLEVQLPFLQCVLSDFKIVPILLNTDSADMCAKLANGLAKTIGSRQDVLCVASTDLSHFYPQDRARQMDNATLKLIQAFDAAGLLKAVAANRADMCGSAAVATLLMTMKQLSVSQVRVLKQATSYDTSGADKNRVVGYASVVIYKESTAQHSTPGGKAMYSPEQRTVMLNTARAAIQTFLKEHRKPELRNSDPALETKCGAFVTLEKKGELRGCIGRIVADEPLLTVIRDMAIEAATGDPRFAPVRPEELKDISLEISVLTPLAEITSIDEIEVGRDGLLIRKGFYSGLLLPQVATEYGWNREEFLQHTCRKAGLPPDAWQKDAQIFRFSAEVFGERP